MGIRQYLRYRDDIIIRVFAGELQSALSWVRALKKKASYFKLTADQVATNTLASVAEVRYLDTTIIFKGKAGILHIEPYIKAEGVPLSSSSAHRSSVHQWPINQIRKIIQHSPNLAVQKQALDKLSTWLQADPATLEKWIHKAKNPTQKLGKSGNDNTVWCVLPWHPAFAIASPIRVAMRQLQGAEKLLEIAFNTPIKVRYSWQNPAASNYMRFNRQHL